MSLPFHKFAHPLSYYHWLLVFGSQQNNKNKPVELLTLVLFDRCYKFRSTFGIFLKQSHLIRLLLLNCPNMDPYYCYSSQSYNTCNRHKIARIFLILKFFNILNLNLKLFKILLSLNVQFGVVFVFLSRIVGCPSPGVASVLYIIQTIHDNVISF
jgi:hypothetical protein